MKTIIFTMLIYKQVLGSAQNLVLVFYITFKLPQAILQISLKTASLLEDLYFIRESLISDSSWISSGKSIPLLPPLKIYLSHIQQIEVGSVVGSNGVIKWSKCR